MQAINPVNYQLSTTTSMISLRQFLQFWRAFMFVPSLPVLWCNYWLWHWVDGLDLKIFFAWWMVCVAVEACFISSTAGAVISQLQKYHFQDHRDEGGRYDAEAQIAVETIMCTCKYMPKLCCVVYAVFGFIPVSIILHHLRPLKPFFGSACPHDRLSQSVKRTVHEDHFWAFSEQLSPAFWSHCTAVKRTKNCHAVVYW